MSHQDDRYVLARGEEARYRLGLVNEVHFPDTERLLLRAGQRSGLRVADIGFGAGFVTAWLAERVSPGGSVTAVDVSAEQVEQTRETCRRAGAENVTTVVASATDTGLPAASFDLVYSRFVLMHLPDPAAAVQEMHRLLKPGGILVVEDGDFTRPFCFPPDKAFDRCFELYRALGAKRGLLFDIGPCLYGGILSDGFEDAEVSLAQPVVVRGDAKRLPEWTLAESSPALVEAGLATAEEIALLVAEMKILAADERVLFAMAQMTQVIARKPIQDRTLSRTSSRFSRRETGKRSTRAE